MTSFLDRLLRRDPDALPHAIRVDRALTLIEEGGLLVDVREAAEWKSGHAPRARHIPLGKLATEARRLPKDSTIVVVCASGSRSRSGAAQLRSAGGVLIAWSPDLRRPARRTSRRRGWWPGIQPIVAGPPLSGTGTLRR